MAQFRSQLHPVRFSDPCFKEIRFRGKTETYFVHDLGKPRFSELDQYGVVWNGHYVNYFETGRLALCAHFGFNMELLSDIGVYLPVYSYEVSMRKPIKPNEQVTVAVRPVHASESVVDFIHLLLVDGEVRATSKLRHVAMDKETGAMAFQLRPDVLEVFRPMREAFSL